MPLIKKDENRQTRDERKSPRDLPALIEELKNPDEQARRWAARDLGEYAEAADALVGCLSTEPIRSVREAIFTSLLRIGDRHTCDCLIELLRSNDAELRNGAIDVLKSLSTEAAPLVERLMTDRDPDVRIFAVNIMGSLRYEAVPKWLSQVVATDPDVNVCCTAIDLLSEVGDLDAIQSLNKAATRFSAEPFVKFAVHYAIETIQGTNQTCS